MEILGLLLLVLISGATLIALLTALTLLLPQAVEKTRYYIEAGIGRSMLLGGVNFLFAIALAALLGWLAQLVGEPLGVIFLLPALLILATAVALMLLGLCALVSLLGSRIGEPASPYKTTLRGGLLIILAGLTPYIGWFVFTPLVLWAGLGGAIQTVVQRKSAPVMVEDKKIQKT